MTEKYGEFSLNSEKWSREDFFTWLKLHKNGYFEKYKENLERLFEMPKLPTTPKVTELSIAETVLSLFEAREYIRIAALQSCGIEDVKDCEELLNLMENAFKVC